MTHQLLVSPAEPWRRWLAAAIDAFLLFVSHVFLWLVGVIALPTWNSLDTVLAGCGAATGFAYLVAFWRLRGGTLGQQVVDIKVVRYDGAPLTWGDALRRLAGYLLAALPWHIGFLSIFWDPYRRGWHDRLARTLVVRRQPTERLLPLPPPAVSPPPFVEEPARPMAWHRWLLAALIYVSIALWFTYPLVRRFSTHCAGDGADAFHFLWSLWHAHEALVKGRESLLTTDLLFFPLRVDLLYYSACWAYAVPAAFALKWLTLTQTYNLLFLLSLSASALAAFALARSLGCDFAGSLLAGILFSFSPYVLSHGGAGHLELVTVEFIALFALLSYRALTRSTEERHGVRSLLLGSFGAGVTLSLVGYGAWYYLVSASLMSVCFLIGIALQKRRNDAPTRPYVILLLIYLSAAVCLAPLLVPMMKERSGKRYMDMPLSVASVYSVDLATAAFSNPLHPLWGKWVRKHLLQGEVSEPVAGLSLLALGLSAVAVRRLYRRVLPWVLTGGVFLILACGPSLRIAHREPTLPAWLALLGGGPPGNGLASPFRAELSMQLAQDAVSRPAELWQTKVSLTMPFLWLRQWFPPVRPIRSPARFIVVTLLCVAVLAAHGLRLARQTAQRHWGRGGEIAVAALAFGVVLFEYQSVPYPTMSTRVSRFYYELAREPKCVVVDVPVEDGRIYNYCQTVHGKPLFFGFHSRVPPHALTFRDGNRLLMSLSPHGDYALRRSLRIESVAESQSLSELRQQFEPSLQELAAHGGKFIIVHKRLLTAAALEQVNHVLRKALALPVRWEDETIRVYQIQKQRQGR
jgi:uncharacterized RDD family membrane protein YckC